MMKVFSLISFSDHPVPWSSASIPLGRCLTPAPFSDESLWTLHLCLTPPLTHRTMRDRLSHCLDVWRFYLPEGTVRICSRVRPCERSGTQIHDPVGRMLWSLKDQGLSKLPDEIQRNTQSPTVAPRGHVGFGLRFKVKAALRQTVWLKPFASSVIPLHF